MKKSLILAAILAVVSVATAVAQPRAIGANLGGTFDVSYQHSLGEANMIDLSVNIPWIDGFGIGASATYDWINPFGTSIPWNYQGSWNWSLGVGAGAGIYGFSSPDIYVGAVGHVGVSYDFWFPLQLSIDWRPNLGWKFGSNDYNTGGLYYGGIGVRYLF